MHYSTTKLVIYNYISVGSTILAHTANRELVTILHNSTVPYTLTYTSLLEVMPIHVQKKSFSILRSVDLQFTANTLRKSHDIYVCEYNYVYM